MKTAWLYVYFTTKAKLLYQFLLKFRNNIPSTKVKAMGVWDFENLIVLSLKVAAT